MPTYIALLRGINVSGQKKINMADLREQLKVLAFTTIRTYIQSGNIIFEAANTSLEQLSEQITENIQQNYGFHVPCLVKTPAKFASIIQENPFPDLDEEGLKRLYVTLLAQTPDTEKVQAIRQQDYAPEQFIQRGTTLYFYSPLGYGRAKMNNNFFEQKLKVPATTRNWKSMNKLLSLAQS